MNIEYLEELLRDISLSAVANYAETDDIESMLNSIAAAVATRAIVDCVQFEELWEESIDESTILFINFKLSPTVCQAAYDEEISVNELTWNLILPDVNDLDKAEKPETAYDWLELANVFVEDEFSPFYDCLSQVIVREDEED